MLCPNCIFETRVTNSRTRNKGSLVWRRRVCGQCKQAFTTYERADLSYILITKRDGSSEKYAHPKLFASIYLANTDPEASYQLALTVEEKLRQLADVIVPTRDIAKIVLDTLEAYDKPTFARFQSYQTKK